MKKLILTIVLCAFAMVVAGLNVRSMQNRGVKEATVEAEVEDIVGMNKGSRGEISWNVIYKYSYKGKEYQKEVDGVRSCQKGEKVRVATVYKGNIIKNLIMDCQSYTKYRPNETTGGIFVSWRRKEELPTGA